jgi:hypothetical protein
VTREETNAYQRGYYAAAIGRWGNHLPLVPPQEIIAQFIKAGKELRDGFDGLCALFGEEDECCVELGPRIDAFDEAMKAMKAWAIDYREAIK